jgi:hypothetical protein
MNIKDSVEDSERDRQDLAQQEEDLNKSLNDHFFQVQERIVAKDTAIAISEQKFESTGLYRKLVNYKEGKLNSSLDFRRVDWSFDSQRSCTN